MGFLKPSQQQMTVGMLGIMAKMPTLSDLNQSKHRSVKIERAKAKQRRKKKRAKRK